MLSFSRRTPGFFGLVGSYRTSHLRRHVSRRVWDASFASMNGWERRTIKLRSGEQVVFRYEAHISSGSFVMELLAPDSNVVVRWDGQSTAITPFTASLPGRHAVLATADHAVGSFRLEVLPAGA
jgi:hypothetical protein